MKMAGERGSDFKSEFRFIQLLKKPSETLQGRKFSEYLRKWALNRSLTIQTYTFDQMYNPFNVENFILSFFKSPDVLSCLKVLSATNDWATLDTPATFVDIVEIPCSVVSMNFFDRLYDGNILRGKGDITKCLEEYENGICIADELRKFLMIEDSDNYHLYNKEERNEFIFRLFKHLCLGGEVCQYEDNIHPYLDVTKSLYKELLSVSKDGETKLVHINSVVFKVTAYKDGIPIYPSSSPRPQDFAYFIVSSSKHTITVLYNKWS